jgi:alkanesulfonate monooxygenase SsuD/methylene tetrahydromethanopterin reductase-like flavin-dependent oxidoreductase (luciferase family)
LAAQFLALEHLAPGRVIAGLGTGDRLSAQENLAYGIPYPNAAERRIEMVSLGRQLIDAGLTVWIAGGPDGRRDEASTAGAALNLWDAETAVIAQHTSYADAIEVTWAGPPPAAMPALAERVRALHEAGASWAIFGWPVDLDELVTAARDASTTRSERRAGRP